MCLGIQSFLGENTLMDCIDAPKKICLIKKIQLKKVLCALMIHIHTHTLHIINNIFSQH